MLRLLCLFVGLAATVNGQCYLPFREVGEGCYYFSFDFGITKKTWTEARQDCQAKGADVDLAVLDTLCDDYRHIENYVLAASDEMLTVNDLWVGATGSDGTWLWVDGRALSISSSHWFHSQPDGTSGCVFMDLGSLYGYTRIFLSDESCSVSKLYICQRNVFAKD